MWKQIILTSIPRPRKAEFHEKPQLMNNSYRVGDVLSGTGFGYLAPTHNRSVQCVQLCPFPTYTMFATVEHDFSIIYNRNSVVHMFVVHRGPPWSTVVEPDATVEKHDFLGILKKNIRRKSFIKTSCLAFNNLKHSNPMQIHEIWLLPVIQCDPVIIYAALTFNV